MSVNKKKSSNSIEFKVSKEGSLGLLAYGDIGLRKWREVKKEYKEKTNPNEEK